MPNKVNQQYGVFGGYASWAHAAADANDYTTDLRIYHKICEEIKNGRSSSRNLTPFIAALETINRPANILDFGGNLGMVYFELNRLMPDRIATWTVADFPDVCDYGTIHLSDNKLSFVTSFASLKPDIVIASHILQYLEHPYSALESLAALKPQAIVLHEVPLALAEPEFAIQNLIPQLGGGRRAVQSLNIESLTHTMPGYTLVSEVILPEWAPALQAKQVAMLYRKTSSIQVEIGGF